MRVRLTNRYDANSFSSAFASFKSGVSKPSVNQPRGVAVAALSDRDDGNHRRCQRWRSAAQVVHSHDTGFVGKVEHWGQNQCAQEQPHGTLHTFPLKT